MVKTKISFILFSLVYGITSYSQTYWESQSYHYKLEIPSGFTQSSTIGKNVDFKATNGINSIVIVVTKLSSDYKNSSIWSLIGDISTFGADWENGAKEYMTNPKFIKSGKTEIDNLETFWYDYQTDSPSLYSKTYQSKSGLLLYTITLSCKTNEQTNYSAVWFRVKESIELE